MLERFNFLTLACRRGLALVDEWNPITKKRTCLVDFRIARHSPSVRIATGTPHERPNRAYAAVFSQCYVK
jgi:hypothetical protein